MKFDELNQLKERFAEFPEEEREKRVSLATKLGEALEYVFALIVVEQKAKINKEPSDYYDLLALRFGDIFDEEDLSYEDETLHDMAQDVVDVTFKHIDEPRYTSKERAAELAEDETYSAFALEEFIEAVNAGKKHKTWVSKNDEKVRLNHEDVDMLTIPINEYFQVGEDRMRFPHDYINGSPANIAYCRCLCFYS